MSLASTRAKLDQRARTSSARRRTTFGSWSSRLAAKIGLSRARPARPNRRQLDRQLGDVGLRDAVVRGGAHGLLLMGVSTSDDLGAAR